VLVEDATAATVTAAVGDRDRTVVDPRRWQTLVAAADGSGPVEPVGGGEDLAVLMFTSGTSGRPKGAMLSHRALLANLDQCSRIEPTPMTPDDVVLVVLPLFHIYGLNAALGMVARTGATAVLVERFDPRETLDVVTRCRVTNIPGAPPMYIAWVQLADAADDRSGVDLGAALGDVRLLASGASPLPPAVLEQVRTSSGLVISEGYGLTETAPVLTSTLGSGRVKPGSVGRPVPGVALRLVDESGAEVADDDAGEIWVRGDNVFSGYWPDGSGGPDDDGWYATGDLGYLDEDGDLFLVGRRKELVLVSGFNVYPREIEEALAEHPDVAESAVIGVPHPHTGEAVKAYVVARPGSGLSAADVTRHCETRLARFKRPTIVEVVDELPHSVTGKVAKGRLRAEAAGLAAPWRRRTPARRPAVRRHASSSSASRAATCATTPGRSWRRSRPRPGSRGRSAASWTTRTCTSATGSRSRSPWSTGARTTSGPSPRRGCAPPWRPDGPGRPLCARVHKRLGWTDRLPRPVVPPGDA
jgi:long-chain acyl-CoA synthetase